MPRLLFLLLILATPMAARAHVGFENNTEIRVYPDSMRVVVRTSVPFAQVLLGNGAPAMADETGQAAAKPLLAKAAADLVSITAGGKRMAPVRTECLFEVQNDVAFILDFPRPEEWPVVVKAEFFPLFGNLETGTMAAFDSTASRFSRDVEPLVSRVIDPRNASISFSPGAPAIAETPVESAGTPLPAMKNAPGGRAKTAAVFLFLMAAGVIGFLARRRWRSIGRDS
ncbi:MAG: hypothetical protein V4584_10615 [Verrucomicrobiota bacterium]